MKKLSFIIIVLILSLSMLLSSCEDSKINEENSNQEDTSATASSTETTTGTSGESSKKPTGNTSGGGHVHTYGNWVTTKEASCKEEGSMARVCSCGSKETQTVATIPHKYVNGACTMCKQTEQSAFVPDYAAGEANVIGSDDADLNYTSQAGYIYYSDGKKIQKVKKNTTTVQSVYTVSSGDVFNVNVVGDWVYFYCSGSTMAKSYIAKVRTDGSGFEKLVSSLYVWEMLVVKDTVYYTTISENWEYVEYGKEVFPLYSVSVNGGSPKQLHDGAVSDLTADATYLYFNHVTENDSGTICRIKHSNTNKNILLQNAENIGLSLENSKLYFFVMDKYEPENLTLASISTSGGSYTTYGKMFCVPISFHVIGNKAYFIGSAPLSEENPEPESGLMEYDMGTKNFKRIREDEDFIGFVSVFDSLICETYNYDSEKLEYIEIYNPSTGLFKKIKVS